MFERKYSKYLLITILSVLALLFFNSRFNFKNSEKPILYLPKHYAIAITPESVNVYMKFWQSDDFYITGTSYDVDEYGNYFVQSFIQASSHYPKASYHSISWHKTEIILNEVSKGKHKIFYKGLENDTLLGEFSWPVETTTYILSTRPYLKYVDMFKQIDLYSETKFPLTQEYFFQEYWIKGVRPEPPIN